MSASKQEVAGRRVVVTGAGGGIGAAITRRLVLQGARVALGDVDLDAAKAAAAAFPDRTCVARLDVTDPDSWAEFAEEIEPQVGAVDVLVNNAGIMPLGSILDEDPDLSRRIVDINLHGLLHGTRAYAPRMIAGGGGTIVNVASAVGRMALGGGATYSASKFGAVGFTEACRAELAPQGVSVSAVLPTVVLTELSAGVAATRGVKPVTADQVAAVVETAIRTGKPEMWVPRYAQGLSRATQVLPRRIQDLAAHWFKADTALADVDTQARAAYEERIRGSL